MQEKNNKTKYVKLGELVVDSAKIIIADPFFIERDKNLTNQLVVFEQFKRMPLFIDPENEGSEPCKALIINTGADGAFEVFGRFEKEKNIGDVLKEVRIIID